MSVVVAQLKESNFDLVHHSHSVFKNLMMAMSFPGKIHFLEEIELNVPGQNNAFKVQPMLTLLDIETSFSVYGRDKIEERDLISYISINTNSDYERLDKADYILCLGSSLDGSFPVLKKGTLSQPDKSATVIYSAIEISERPNNNGIHISLTGSGIKDKTELYISGLDIDEVRQWRSYKNDFPMGIDIFLITEKGKLIGIPRSAELTVLGDY